MEWMKVKAASSDSPEQRVQATATAADISLCCDAASILKK